MKLLKLILGTFLTLLGILIILPVPYASANGCQTVRYKFTTYDNGMGGIWANDYFDSPVTICPDPEIENQYTITFVDDGSRFETLLGANSPGGNGVISGDQVSGTINGGETIVVQGDLKDNIPSEIGPIDFRGMPSPRQYEFPFFNGEYVILDYVSWGWDYLADCSTEAWHDNDVAEALYGAIGPNSVMGDITKKVVCPPEPKQNDCRKYNDARWGDRPINKDTTLRYGKNHPRCDLWFPGYKWWWLTHRDLLRKHHDH